MYQLRTAWAGVASRARNVSGCGNASVTALAIRPGAAAHAAYVVAAPQSWPTSWIGAPGPAHASAIASASAASVSRSYGPSSGEGEYPRIHGASTRNPRAASSPRKLAAVGGWSGNPWRKTSGRAAGSPSSRAENCPRGVVTTMRCMAGYEATRWSAISWCSTSRW